MVVDVSENKYKIGIIEFLDVIDEASVESSKRNVNIKKIGKCSVEVRDKEGPIPHMHSDSEDGSFKACVCLHTNMYFSHDKIKYDQFSNSKQLHDLDKWLRNPNVKYGQGRTNYQVAVDLWFMNGNPDYGFDMSVQPDYTTLSGEIQEK